MAEEPNETYALRSLRSLHVDFTDGWIELADDKGTTLRLTIPARAKVPVDADEQPTDGGPAATAEAPASAGELGPARKTVQLTGRLKSKPRPGRPDGQGKPTSWAKFAAHVEGEPEAHMYSATFHRQTAALALELGAEARVTVQGYVRPAKLPGRMDGLSVFAILARPGGADQGAG